MRIPHPDPPNPGTQEALNQGCICPVIDNHHGRGYGGGIFRDVNGKPAFVVVEGCPLHDADGPEAFAGTLMDGLEEE